MGALSSPVLHPLIIWRIGIGKIYGLFYNIKQGYDSQTEPLSSITRLN